MIPPSPLDEAPTEVNILGDIIMEARPQQPAGSNSITTVIEDIFQRNGLSAEENVGFVEKSEQTFVADFIPVSKVVNRTNRIQVSRSADITTASAECSVVSEKLLDSLPDDKLSLGKISVQRKRKVHPDLELMSFGELGPGSSLNPLAPDFIPISVALPPFDADDEIKRSAEENKNLRIDAAKKSDELKNTRSQNDLLRAKLLQNDLTKYREILRMKQANNLDVITLPRESPELENIPQIQLALNSLDEYTARLLLAEEELDNEYATLVREAEENKTIQELKSDMSSVETPNLDHSTLNLLQSLVIQNRSSSRPTVSPFSFPPATASRSSVSPPLSSLSSRTGDGRSNDIAKAVFFKPLSRCTTLSMLPGKSYKVL